MMFIKKDNRKISEKKIPLTNIIETKILIKNYIKMKKKSKAKSIYKLLMLRIINAGKKGIPLTKNIFKEVSDIQKMLKK